MNTSRPGGGQYLDYAGAMAPEAQNVQIDGRRLRITNLDKVVYPETGTTKGEVIAYYTVSYTHLTLPTKLRCRSRWSPYH